VGRRCAIAAGIGAGLGLVWWVLIQLISAGLVCSKETWSCLGWAVFAVPVAVIVGGIVGWLVLRAVELSRSWLVALVGTAGAAAFLYLARLVWPSGWVFLVVVLVTAGAYALGALITA
jgi:hypothetical protein